MTRICYQIIVVLILLGSAAHAQTGSIRGTVTDPSGAVIAGADIAAVENATGRQHRVHSNRSGAFIIPVLAPGAYDVVISDAGFRTTVVSAVLVTVTEATPVEVQLQVGSAAETITIMATPLLLRTEGPQLGDAVSGATLTQLPLSTRNFSQTLALQAGTSAFLPDATGVGRNTQVIEVNGARPTQNNYGVNGVDANTLGTNGPVLVPIPAPEAIEEFKVQTALYDATYGRAGGANVQVLTRSGSDHFHGTAYEFLRNECFNANDSFLKSAGVRRPILRRNMFGGTLGGPLRPKDVFFFVSYQGTREENGASLLNSISSHVTVAPGLTDDRSLATLTSTFKLPGPIDSRSLALLNARLPNGSYVIPTPALDGTYTTSTPSSFVEDQFNSNIEWQIRSNDVLTAKFFFANSSGHLSLPSFRGSGPNVPGFGSQTEFNNRVASVQQVHTFNSQAVNEARLGYTLNRNNTSPDEPINDAQLGIPRSTASAYPGLPLIRIAASSGGVIFGTAPAIDGRAGAWTWTAADVLSLVSGRHSYRFGGELRFNGINYAIPNFSRGQIDFASFTSFLLGQAQSSTLGAGLVGRSWRASDYNLFVQDDIRLTARLTINFGLRYELDLPTHDTHGKLTTFDPQLYEPRLVVSNGLPIGPPSAGFVQADSGSLELSGVMRGSETVLHKTDVHNFAPRVGFAWSPPMVNSVVVRGGFGIFFSRPTFQYTSLTDRLPPYYVLASKRTTSLADPFFALPPPARFPVFVPGVLLSGSPFDRNLHTPRFEQFALTIQRELFPRLVLEIGYAGSRGDRLFRQVAINAAQLASPSFPVFNPVLKTQIVNNTPDNAQLRAPLQGVSMNGFTQNQSSGESHYNSLQVNVTRHAARGPMLQATYTFSKSTDNGSGQGGGAGPVGLLNTSSVGDTGTVLGIPGYTYMNRGLSDFDRTHVLTAQFTWVITATGTGGASQILLHGWQLSGIVIAMSGSPIDVVDTTAGSLYGLDKGSSALARSNFAPGESCGSAIRNVPDGYYFNPSAFASPIVLAGNPIPSSEGVAIAGAKGTDFGTAGRNCLRGPAQANVDIAFGRTIQLAERRALKLGFEVFNLMNRANRANPVSDLAAAAATGGNIDPTTGKVISGGNFGRIIASSSNPRILQISIHFDF